MTPKISLTLLRTQTDERLIKLSSLGHESAFEALVERYRKPLHRYCRRIVTENRAEDAVQQTFLNAWQSLRKGTEVKDARAWLYRIAHNEAVRAVNKHGYDYDELVETIKGEGEPHDDAERRAVIRQTFMSLAALPERQRDTLLQIAIEGRSYAEVAENFGMSEGAVRQILFRARTTVRSAAAAVVPMPLILWFAESASGNSTMPARITELVSVGGGGGAIGIAAKTCAVVVTAGAVAAAPVAINRAEPPRAEAKAAAADLFESSASDDVLARLGVVFSGNRASGDRAGKHDSGDDDSADDKGDGRESEREGHDRDQQSGDGRHGSSGDSDDDSSDNEDPDSDSGSDQTRDTEPQSKSNSGPGSGSDSEPESESGSGSGSESGSNSGSGSDSGLSLVPPTAVDGLSTSGGSGS